MSFRICLVQVLAEPVHSGVLRTLKTILLYGVARVTPGSKSLDESILPC